MILELSQDSMMELMALRILVMLDILINHQLEEVHVQIQQPILIFMIK